MDYVNGPDPDRFEREARAAGTFEHYMPQPNGHDRVAPKPRRTRFETSASIMATKFEPLRWAVPGYVPEGFSVLAGRQKLGKSRMALDWSIAVAEGGYAMGAVECPPGDVLYIDLENGRRRVQRRIAEAYPDERERPALDRLTWLFEVPAIGSGFLDVLDEWCASVENPRLIVVDVLQRIKPQGGGNKQHNAYERDYAVWGDVQTWAASKGVALVGLHHTRKGGADDPLESLSGSNGLSAVADTTLVLDRGSEGASLYVRGRDVEDHDEALRSIDGKWVTMGDAAEVRRSSERGRILAALEDADEPLSPAGIADATGMKGGNVRYLLHQMMKAGEVQKEGRGLYTPNKANTPNDGEEGE